MKLDKFQKLKVRLEILKLEKNFFALDRVLYYFSFLGNIFLVYFGYFFIKNIVDTLPQMFPYQTEFLSVRIDQKIRYRTAKRVFYSDQKVFYLERNSWIFVRCVPNSWIFLLIFKRSSQIGRLFRYDRNRNR